MGEPWSGESRQYVRKDGDVRWFPTDAAHFRNLNGHIYSRIPPFAKVKGQLALAAEITGSDLNAEDTEINVAVPDGEGGFDSVQVRWDHDKGEWVSGG